MSDSLNKEESDSFKKSRPLQEAAFAAVVVLIALSSDHLLSRLLLSVAIADDGMSNELERLLFGNNGDWSTFLVVVVEKISLLSIALRTDGSSHLLWNVTEEPNDFVDCVCSDVLKPAESESQ